MDIIETQKQTKQTLIDLNNQLSSFNKFSNQRFLKKRVSVKLFLDLKSDLDLIFKRIQKLRKAMEGSRKHQAAMSVLGERPVLEDD
ncbi:hypothetical protein BC833DRAFT_620003 [Globomyces pollinis-pini]|nr:hypothetical protein BC833DRAFT_620003 [Globomyces pollinis-pini]